VSAMRAGRARRNGILLAGGICLLVSTGCGSGSGSSLSGTGTSGSSTGGSGTTPTTVNNTQPVQVGVGPTGGDVNQLLTSVTVCLPATNNCQTISNILVDTGSSGLRLLAPSVTLTLPRASDSSGNPLGNCATFANNNYAWGPVATADIQIAGEAASSVPIQLIGAASFPPVPEACDTGGTATSAALLGAEGILGVGIFRQDCGSACASAGSQLPSIYFSCPSSGCVATAVSLQKQIQNPVPLFPQDNNGVLISLPALSQNGSQSVSGSLIFGIGTQSNNTLTGAQVYTTDTNGNFTVTFNGVNHSDSFVDSGSNGIFFLNARELGIPTCSDNTSFYCPPSTVNASAITTGANGASNAIAFSIANADQLFATGNNAFNDLGGPTAGGFDLGLPFFYGRAVYVAIEGQSTSAGSGPYWAF
jgi:Protein of unknown function (DUF3443)